MYLQNKYTRWYNNIIANAQLRVLLSTTYSEKHHIVPKSLGGNNSKLNLVKLTAKEHYICHLLLPEIPKKSKVAWNKGLLKTTDARIAKLSKKVSIAMTGVKRGPYKTHK